MKTLLCLTLFAFFTTAYAGQSDRRPAANEITTKEVKYKVDGKEHVGFVAMPKTLSKDTPAVLVIHEWWGQTDYPRKRAKMLAEMGYIAMAADMYGERKVVNHPKEAGKFSSMAMKDTKTVGTRFKAAYDELLKVKNVDKAKVAAIGYCFGGGVVIDAAKQNMDLKGIVSFHGSLATPTKAKKGNIKAELLVINGADDSFISADAIASFKKDMDSASAKYKFVNLPGAVHGFTNPEATANGKKFKIPLAYNKDADEKSWAMMSSFFNRIFK